MIVCDQALRNDVIGPAVCVAILMVDGKTDRKFFLLHSDAYCHRCNTEVVGCNFACDFLHGSDLVIGVLSQSSSPPSENVIINYIRNFDI